jgi:SsrA-binding protein
VKSLRLGRGSIAESYAQPMSGEIMLVNFHIPAYEQGNIHNVEPMRSRKLLLHRREIDRLIGSVTRKGYTLVPLQVYFHKGKVKVEIALGRGKKEYDKREDIKKRDQERDMRRVFRKSS